MAAGIFFSEPMLFFLPLALLLLLVLMQYPRLLFYVLLFSIPWSVEWAVNDSIGTDLPDEPLMVLMAFATIALLLTRRQLDTKKIPSLLWLLILTIAWSVVPVLASTQVLLSLKFFLARSWYLLAFVGAPLLLQGDEKLIKHSAIVLFSSMLLVTCVGLYRHALLNFTFANINEAIAPFFRNHVNYSALLVFMVPMQVAFYRLANSKRLRRLLILSLVVVLAALYLSFARGAWLALIIGFFAFVLLRKRWLVKSYLLLVIAILCGTIWLSQNERYLQFAPKHDSTIFHENFAEHLVATYKGKDVSTAERFYRWVAGVRMSTDRPLIGFGPTTFTQHYKSYTVPAFRTWVSKNKEQSTVHNYFLLLLIEQGIPGLCFFLLLLGAMFWHAQTIYHRTTSSFWKTTTAAIAVILAMQCALNFLSDLIETDKVGSVFYLCLAFLILADAKTRKIKDEVKT
jgi:O-antigen ligase